MILKATLGSFLVLGALTPGIVAIDGDDKAATSYEQFVEMLVGESDRAAVASKYATALRALGMQTQDEYRAAAELSFAEHARRMEEREADMQELYRAYELSSEQGDFQHAHELAAELQRVSDQADERRRAIARARESGALEDDTLREMNQHIEDLSAVVNELESELAHALREGAAGHAREISSESERVVRELRAMQATR